MFKAQLKGQSSISKLPISIFEELFNFKYSSQLLFSSEQNKQEIAANCPYLFRLDWLFGKSQLEEGFEKKLSNEEYAPTIVKWINEEKGYGLFAEKDLKQYAFVGEYTGLVRKIDNKHLKINPYCFSYPKKLFGKQDFIIDALEVGNLSRFINHSDRPNLQPLWLNKEGFSHLIFYTNRPIKGDTELTFDYGFKLS